MELSIQPMSGGGINTTLAGTTPLGFSGSTSSGSGFMSSTLSSLVGSIGLENIASAGLTGGLSVASNLIFDTLMGIVNKSATTLEETTALFNSQKQYLDSMVAMINLSNVNEIINEMERFTAYWYFHLRNMLARRSWSANATAGWTFQRDQMLNYRNNTLSPLIQNIVNQGFQMSFEIKNVSEQSLEDLYNSTVTADNTTAEKNGNISYKVYKFSGSSKTASVNEIDTDTTKTNKMSMGIIAVIFGAMIFGVVKLSKK